MTTITLISNFSEIGFSALQQTLIYKDLKIIHDTKQKLYFHREHGWFEFSVSDVHNRIIYITEWYSIVLDKDRVVEISL